MKNISKPNIAITEEEKSNLLHLLANNPVCKTLDCTDLNCDDCPFNEIINEIGKVFSQTRQIIATLPIYKEGE